MLSLFTGLHDYAEIFTSLFHSAAADARGIADHAPDSRIAGRIACRVYALRYAVEG